MQIDEFSDFLRQSAVQAFAQGVHLFAHHADGGMQASELGIDIVDAFFSNLQRMRNAQARATQGAAA